MSGLRARRIQRIRDLADLGKTRREIADELLMSYMTVVKYGREFGIKFRHGSKGVGVDEERADAMEAMFRSGKTLEEIGAVYGVTRERVRQVIRKYRGVTGGDGGIQARAKIERGRRRAEREVKCLQEKGCSTEQLATLRKIGREMIASGYSANQTPIGAFANQRSSAVGRGIGWKLKLWEWWTVWQQSGKWGERGRAANAYVMCRFRDDGPYEVGNVYIATLRHNSILQPNNPYRRGHPNFEVTRKKRAVSQRGGNTHRPVNPELPRGVTVSKGRFIAQASIDGRNRYLGSYGSADDAHAAYLAAIEVCASIREASA